MKDRYGQKNKKNKMEDTLLVPCTSDSSHPIPSLGSVYITVDNKPFRIYTVFFIGHRDRLEKELKRNEKVDFSKLNLDDEKTFSGITVPVSTDNGHSFVLVWMPEFCWSLEDLETLSHECLHAAIMVMRMSGVRARIFEADSDENCDDEGLCYNQSSMFSSILSELIKRQNKAFKKAITSRNR